LLAPLLMALLRPPDAKLLIDAHSSVGADYVTYDVMARGSEQKLAHTPQVCESHTFSPHSFQAAVSV